MQLLCISDNLEYKYFFVFVGYGLEVGNMVIELIYNYGVSEYDFGLVFGYLVIEVDNVV